ncbi:MAG: two-component system activity regulator YycH [Tepidanaerobacteraceae bacterium]|jgi:regulatory protein YycH of two-component signal transduction system YycFG|nr:two-component system activity regulator YycH [Tepidanaerobacteraceae bacterium]
MTRDSILGWILIFMVGLSLFLYFAVWSGIPGEQSVQKSLQEEKKVDLTTIASPARILAHMGNASNTLITPSSAFYDKVWNYSSKTLTAVWDGAKAAPVEIGADFFEQRTGLEVVFTTPMPVSFVKRLFNIESADDPAYDSTTIASYGLMEDGGLWAYLRGGDGKYYKINKNADSGELMALIKEISSSNPPLFATIPPGNTRLKIARGIYVPLQSYILPTYGLKRDKIVSDRLASKFFDDFSVVRKIEETDGAVIYTDGQRALRIYRDGTLEYSFPGVKEQKRNVSFYDALKSALDFINSHGGWPQGGFLSSYDVLSQDAGANQYRFKFGLRINGYPLAGEKEYMSVTVVGSQVKNYYRNMVSADKPGKLTEMISPIKAMDIAVATRDVKAMEDISAGYILEKDEFIPVWIIKSQGREIIIRNLAE